MRTRADIRNAPTVAQTAAYQGLFDYFNRALFGDTLPACILNFSRLAKSHGFFVARTWVGDADPDAALAEISLNPDTLDRPAVDAAATLVHEMVHLWQDSHGTPPRRCYHDREWAGKMDAVGLTPSSTGAPGGKRTGQSMTHYVTPGGPFAEAFAKLPAELLLPWRAKRYGGDKEKAKRQQKKKVAYQCPGCEAKAWGKPELHLACEDCEETMVAEAKDDDATDDDAGDN